MGEGVGAPQWVGDEPKNTIFPVSCWNRFPAAESYRHHGAPGGEEASATAEPHRETPGSKGTPARFAFCGKSGLSLDGRTNNEVAEGVL